MSDILVHGVGVVSPAGWGVEKFRQSLAANSPVPPKKLSRAGATHDIFVRPVPAPESKPPFLAHQRLRRTSPISHYIVASGLEALGSDAKNIAGSKSRLGIVSCVMSGCVNYSRRFYDEVLRDPATSSPLVFPETVFNAPASHLASLLGTTALNYTVVGDSAAFLEGISIAANWLNDDLLDGCLVIGAEESDWLTSEAFHLFSRQLILSEGAGAIYLKKESSKTAVATLQAVTDPHIFLSRSERTAAARNVRRQLNAELPDELVVDGLQGIAFFDVAETEAWADCAASRLSPKKSLGEGLIACSAWQCIAAIDAIMHERYRSASVCVVGSNQQAIGAKFTALQD